MMTLRRFVADPPDVPMGTAWYLADLAESRGKQELYIRQSPQRLKALREHAIIESAISSNRIEGVEIERARVRTVVLGKPALRDRNEEEIAGYRDALRLVHGSGRGLPVSEETIRRLHRLSRGDVWDAGQYKQKDVDIVESYSDGRSRIRFRTVPASETAGAMKELTRLWARATEGGLIHPLLALAAFNLDFLCVHPFRDGNGRVSRLLLLLQSYHAGLEVGRYISLERVVEQNKDRYYETLEESSRGWHKGEHNPWPCINYLLYVFKAACRDFEDRVGQMKAPRGEKRAAVQTAIDRMAGQFSVGDLQNECPGVSVDMIRKVLKYLRDQGRVECLGRGRMALWRKTAGELGTNESIGA